MERILNLKRGLISCKCAKCGYIGEIALYQEWYKWGAKSPDLYLCDRCWTVCRFGT